MTELKNERERQANVKRKYGLKSLDYLIGDLDASLTEYEIRKGEGENMDIAIRNALKGRRIILLHQKILRKK